jgi:hypothetical protein
MDKTIETGIVFNAIGKAIAERSGFKPVDMSIDLATVPQETLLRLARQGAVIFVSRMFAADKDAKIKESDYADAIATMFEAWKNGKEWRAKGEGKPKISGTDFKAKATKILAQLYAKSQKWDFKDVDKAKAAWAFVQTNWADKVEFKAKQLEDDAAWEASLVEVVTEKLDKEPKTITLTEDETAQVIAKAKAKTAEEITF